MADEDDTLARLALPGTVCLSVSDGLEMVLAVKGDFSRSAASKFLRETLDPAEAICHGEAGFSSEDVFGAVSNVGDAIL